MSTIEINGDDWPVAFNFSAMRRCLPLFGLSKLSEINLMLERLSSMDFPAEAVEPFLRNIVWAGLRLHKDERECPAIEYFEDAMNEDMTLLVKAVTALNDGEEEEPAKEPGKKAAPGKSKRRTTKP